MPLTPRHKLDLKRLTPQQQTSMKPRLNTQIQLPLGLNIKRPHQLRRHRQEPILRKHVPRTLAAPAAKRVAHLAALGLACFCGKRGAVGIVQVAVRVESFWGGEEGGVVGVGPDVLQNNGAGGDVVAAEGVVGVEGVGEVDGGYGAPAEGLPALAGGVLLGGW